MRTFLLYFILPFCFFNSQAGTNMPLELKKYGDPVVALTFDVFPETIHHAFTLMQENNLIGTYYVNPETIDTPFGPSSVQLKAMLKKGWSIGAYSGKNMIDLANYDKRHAQAWLIYLRNKMKEKGFPTKSLAPSQRAWSAELSRMAKIAGFTTVRAPKLRTPEIYPFVNPLWIGAGGTDSLGFKDTKESLENKLLNLEKHGGAWIVIIHKVGDDSDPNYSISSVTFSNFLSLVSNFSKRNSIKVIVL